MGKNRYYYIAIVPAKFDSAPLEELWRYLRILRMFMILTFESCHRMFFVTPSSISCRSPPLVHKHNAVQQLVGRVKGLGGRVEED